MSPFLQALKRGCEEAGLIGRRVLVGVSGGADSMALVRGLLQLREELYVTICVGHLNHKLRGPESDQDAAWIAEECGRLEVRLIVEEADVEGLAKERGEGTEEAARHARYEFLSRAADEAVCTHIAVGHTADDQAETILHHVVRGTGFRGLRGIPAERTLISGKSLVRPMLDIRRAEVLTYLDAIGQDFREDSSNSRPDYTRNRIRQELIPLLEREYNPQVRTALLRLGRQAAELQEVLDDMAQELLDRAVVDRTATVCRLNWREFEGKSRHLVRACFTRLWQMQNWPRGRMGFGEWERLAEIAAQGGMAVLPGNIHVRRRAGLVVLEQR